MPSMSTPDQAEAPTIEPYPNAVTRWDYAQAQHTTEVLHHTADPNQVAAILTGFIFRTHPDILDLPPAVWHRLQQSQAVMTAYDNGQELLQASILDHFQTAHQGFQEGYTLAETATCMPSNPATPRVVHENGKHAQRIMLPPEVQESAIAWNERAQQMICADNITELFAGHPHWVGVKLAEGSWLQAGNLMMEIGESLARIRTRHHLRAGVEAKLGLTPQSDEWAADLDDWYIMTHIMDKQLLELASELDEDMIYGRRLTPEVYARSYVPMRHLIEHNPNLHIAGALSDGTWAYSSEVKRLFPQQSIAGLHDIVGTVAEVGTASELNLPAQITFATYNAEREAAFRAGRYHVGIAARFISYEEMGEVIQMFA